MWIHPVFFVCDQPQLGCHCEMRNWYINCLVDFPEEGELIKDIELLMHFRYRCRAHLHQLPKGEILELFLLLFTEAVWGKLQFLLEYGDRFLRFVEQFLNIFLNLTATLVFEITNVLQLLKKIFLEVITCFAANQLLKAGNLFAKPFEPVEGLLGGPKGIFVVFDLGANCAKLETIGDEL